MDRGAFGLQLTGLQRVGHDRATNTLTFYKRSQEQDSEKERVMVDPGAAGEESKRPGGCTQQGHVAASWGR